MDGEEFSALTIDRLSKSQNPNDIVLEEFLYYGK